MGISCTFWEEIPERVEYYLNNHEWPSRVDSGLGYHDMGKSWKGFHDIFCRIGDKHSFPSNFILNGENLPNYEVEEHLKDNARYIEWSSPFLYSVAKTKEISEFLDSLDRSKLRQGYDSYILDRVKSGRKLGILPKDDDYYLDKERMDTGFLEMYHSFEWIQRFFHLAAAHKNCVIGRMG